MEKRDLGRAAKDSLAKSQSFIEAAEVAQAKKSENRKLKILNTRLEPRMIKAIRVYCAQKDLTMRGFVLEALEKKMDKLGIKY